MSAQPAHDPGPKYFVNIEGVEHAWDQATITVPQLRDLAAWDASQQVVEVDLESFTEITLADDAVITLKPGHGFAKKIKFQRG
jgi:hypothetical protein